MGELLDKAGALTREKTLAVNALPGYAPEIGRWLWAMNEVRRRTLRLVEGLDQRTLDWAGADGRENAIGTLLYHIAAVEMGWLFIDIKEGDLPPHVKHDFPFDTASNGRLTPVLQTPLAEHLRRLESSRKIFLDSLKEMSIEDWRQFRQPGDEDYAVTPEWAVFHLVEHEAGHAFQISSLKARARRLFGSSEPR
jgi:uncharacterized damage-inducible protein DinB